MSAGVLYLHNSVEISGGERSLLGLWSALDRQRFSPCAVLPSEGPLAAAARQGGVPVHCCSVPAWRPWYAVELHRVHRKLCELVRSAGVRVIHSYSPRNNLMAVWVARSCGIRVVWHERNIPVPGEMDISRLLQRLPDALICNSRAVAARFQATGRVSAILNGVDLVYFRPDADKTAARCQLGIAAGRVVGVLANYSPRKQLEVFLAAAALVKKRDPEVVFVVVGGDYGPASSGRRALLGSAAQQFGLDGRIIWAGFQQDVRPWIAAMDVVCHPTAGEACSRAILEAMAMVRPVVAFADGGNPEIITDGRDGLLVRPGDTAAMAEGVLGLLADEDRRQRFGTDARERVEQDFSIQRNARQTMEVYTRLCG